MNNDLYRIVYCSRNLINPSGARTDQDAELERILHAARTNNASQGVTGALLFNSECFAQVLEGPRKSVERIFEVIQRDRRHGQITVVDNGWADGRDFPNWAMAHAQPLDQQAEGIASTLQLALIQPSVGSTEVLDLLKDLVSQE
jgi:hypothetical protein